MNSKSGKTYIVNDQPPKNGETDALDFTPREAVETLDPLLPPLAKHPTITKRPG